MLKHVETLYIAKLCQAQLLVGYHSLPLTNHFPNHSHTEVLLCKLHCFNTCGIWSKKRSHNAKKLEWFLFFPAIGIHNDIIHVQRCAESIWTKQLADLEACSVWCLIRLSLHYKKATWDGLTLSFDEQHGMVRGFLVHNSHDFGKSHLLLGETSQRSDCSFDILWLNGPPKKTHRHAPRGERHLWSTLDLAQGWHWLIHLESINRIQYQWISMAWCKFDEKPSSNTDFTAKKSPSTNSRIVSPRILWVNRL